MKRFVIIVSVLLGVILLAGCATGPKSALSGKVLRSDYVVYFEQSDRVPKEVLLAANKEPQPLASALGAVPVEVIAEVIDKVLEIVPKVTEGYGEERMANALIGRRMLFVGYDQTEQLREIKNIVDSMGSSIEYITPQYAPGAGVRAFGKPVEK